MARLVSVLRMRESNSVRCAYGVDGARRRVVVYKSRRQRGDLSGGGEARDNVCAQQTVTLGPTIVVFHCQYITLLHLF